MAILHLASDLHPVVCNHVLHLASGVDVGLQTTLSLVLIVLSLLEEISRGQSSVGAPESSHGLGQFGVALGFVLLLGGCGIL